MTGQKIQSQEAIKIIEREKKQYFNCSAVQSVHSVELKTIFGGGLCKIIRGT